MNRSSAQRRFEDLYDEHHRLVRGVLYNMAGAGPLDDLTQETFLRAWRGLPRFAFRSSIKTWICRIAINAAIDHLRRKPLTGGGDPDALEAAPEPGRERAALVQAALREIDEAHRAVIVLHYFEGLALDEVASILEIPSGTVKSRLHNGREKLKTVLRAKGWDYE